MEPESEEKPMKMLEISIDESFIPSGFKASEFRVPNENDYFLGASGAIHKPGHFYPGFKEPRLIVVPEHEIRSQQ